SPLIGAHCELPRVLSLAWCRRHQNATVRPTAPAPSSRLPPCASPHGAAMRANANRPPWPRASPTAPAPPSLAMHRQEPPPPPPPPPARGGPAAPGAGGGGGRLV